jgi:hypothetical protein
MSDLPSLVSENIDIWTSAIVRKSGNGNRINLYPSTGPKRDAL